MKIKRRYFAESLKKKFWDNVDIKDKNECWNWKGTLNGKPKRKYGTFYLYGKTRLAHRIAYAIHTNNRNILEHNKSYHKDNNNFKCICHSCDNTKCCNPNHLFIGNNQDNINDKISKNRQQRMRGSLNGHSKLTEKEVLKIRKEYIPRKNGGIISLSKKYNISITNIHDIIKRKIWKHI